jgi:hypothetical protein
LEPSPNSQNSRQGDFLALGAIALAVMVLHIATNGRYGFHPVRPEFPSAEIGL